MNASTITLTTAILSGLLATAATCQSPVDMEVVLDPNTTPIGLSSSPSTLNGAESETTTAVVIGAYAYFSATSDLGRELWRCQAAAGTAELVADVNPGPLGSAPRHHTAVGNVLFFTADDGVHGRELWRTDGTANGTTLVADLVQGASGAIYSSFAAAGNRLFFSCDAGLGFELYVHDTTTGTTALVVDIQPGPASASVFSLRATPSGNGVVFKADDGVNGYEIWSSQGSSSNTMMLADLSVGAGQSHARLEEALELGGHLYFGASSATNEPLLCRTDGSTLDVVRTFPAMPFLRVPEAEFVFGNEAWFNIDTPGIGYEIWRCDGTTASTVLFDDLNPGPGSTFVGKAAVAGDGSAFFLRFGQDMLISDGTLANTTIHAGVSPRDMIGSGAGIICRLVEDPTIGEELYSIQTDGTTQLIADISSGDESSEPRSLMPFGNQILFAADSSETGVELYITDGTTIGTQRIDDIDPRTTTAEFGLTDAVSAGNRAFLGGDGAGLGRELWVTDGTASGTQLVKDIHVGADDSWPDEFAAIGRNVVFRANDGIAGSELWFSDGTSQGTQLIKDIHVGNESSWLEWTVQMEGIVYFSADDGVNGRELWRTDGTASGTFLLADIYPGSDSSNPQNLTVGGRYLFFQADDGVNGSELWRTDGTAAGTVMVDDINTGPGGSSPGFLHPLRDGVAFLATLPGRQYPWSSDGLSVTQLADNTTMNSNRAIDLVTTEGGRIYLLTDGVFNNVGDLFLVENGTLTQLSSTSPTDFLRDLRAVGESVVFRNLPPETLWSSGGTVASTGMISPVRGNVKGGHAVGNVFYYAGLSAAEGSALWRTDGTAAGTFVLDNFIPGDEGANVEDFVQIAGDLLFFADSPSQQDVLRVLRRPGASVLPFGQVCRTSDRSLQISPPRLGGTMTIDAQGPADAIGLAIGIDFAPGMSFSLQNYTLYFGPMSTTAFTAFGPDLIVNANVPNDPNLIELEFSMQALWMNAAAEISTSKGLWVTLDDK